MKPGQSGTVIAIGPGRGMRRLEAMGLRPGRRIVKISSVFGHGPVTLQIMGSTQLAIGYGMAQKILVEVDTA